MPAKLSVNVNKVALLRNARPGEVPSVVEVARAALDAGAHGITVHPRPDQRHIRTGDVDDLAELLALPQYADREFNIEGNPLDSGGGHLMEILRRIRPTQATLVPDDPTQSTSDHGFPLTRPEVVAELTPIVAELREQGTRVSLFVDPDPETAEAAKLTGAHRIELYTERYAKNFGTLKQTPVLDRFVSTAARAQAVGLGVNAGHDLDLENLRCFAENVPNLLEVSIGHALIADALHDGIKNTVKNYVLCLRSL
ncbi:MAG: pyridoxine 5'-phosphate synthase [Planctomycetota bacterium]